MSINEIQDQIIEEFSELDDWMDKYQLLIDLGSDQEPLAEEYKTDSNLIEGCQSRVWLQADEVEGRLVFQAESDALIVKGIVSLLVKVLSGHTAEEIADANLYLFIKTENLQDMLVSPVITEQSMNMSLRITLIPAECLKITFTLLNLEVFPLLKFSTLKEKSFLLLQKFAKAQAQQVQTAI